MITLNQVVQRLSDLAAAHAQIQGFGYGDIRELGKSEAAQYTVLWVSLGNARVQGKELSIQLTLHFADQVRPDRSNELEVQSDLLLIAADMLAQLDDPSFSDDFILDEVSYLESFYEKFDDVISGWKTDVTLRIPYLADRCQVPVS